jgi:hypothetical protein
MRHASDTMTWDRYGHLYDSDLDSVGIRLDAAAREEVCGPLADWLRTNTPQAPAFGVSASL